MAFPPDLTRGSKKTRQPCQPSPLTMEMTMLLHQPVHCDAKQNPYLILSAVRGTRSYSVPTCQPIPKAHDSTLEYKAGVSIGVRARDQTELRFMLENFK
jgi:hypothetical protein